MELSSHKWVLRPTSVSEDYVESLANQLKISPLIAKILCQRNVLSYEDAKMFYTNSLEDLHDPFQMLGMERAVHRLHQAVKEREKILLYGDFDADGTLAVSLLYNFLRDLGCDVDYYFPNRSLEGYGFSQLGLDYAIAKSIDLLFLLDCGVNEVRRIALAKTARIDVIVCDHHLPGWMLPEPYAMLNPKQPRCQYPFKGLCGCAVTYKMLQAYCIRQKIDLSQLNKYLDLVALATIADMVPLCGENRILATRGLALLNDTSSTIGTHALRLAVSKQEVLMPFSSRDVAFLLVPPINAVGRLFQAEAVVHLMTSTQLPMANYWAKYLVLSNEKRRQITQNVSEEALTILQQREGEANKASTIVMNQGWDRGVIGIVASRLLEYYYRPTLVMTQIGGEIVGSGRSVGSFHLHEALTACEEHLQRFGGHAGAAGFTLKSGHYEPFVQQFEDYVATHIIPEDQERKLVIDAIVGLHEIDSKLIQLLFRMEPCGQENVTPILRSDKVSAVDNQVQLIGEDQSHISFVVYVPGLEQNVKAVAFGKAHWKDRIEAGDFDMCYTFADNCFQGHHTLEILVHDIR